MSTCATGASALVAARPPEGLQSKQRHFRRKQIPDLISGTAKGDQNRAPLASPEANYWARGESVWRGLDSSLAASLAAPVSPWKQICEFKSILGSSSARVGT